MKAVRRLEDSENKYIIVLDNAFDNLQAIMEQKRLHEFAAEKENVILLDIICFEFILLEFRNLIEWVYAPNDEFLRKRAKAIAARESLVNCILTGNAAYADEKEIAEYDENLTGYNIEQLSVLHPSGSCGSADYLR